MAELRSLVIVLVDLLDPDAAAFDSFDAGVDAVWMAELAEESTPVWSSKPRAQRRQRVPVHHPLLGLPDAP